MIVLEILLAWLFADLVAGFVHWWEDRYLDGEYSIKLLQEISEDNELHHNQPTAMLLGTPWTNIRSSVMFALPLGIILWLCGAPFIIWLGVILSGIGNLIHRWAHTPKRQLAWPIRAMQYIGLFQSHEEHDLHHRSMKKLIPKHLAGYKFCPLTNWLNPVMDGLKIWDGLEWMLDKAGWETTQKIKERNS
jgi:hypothetical protein